MAFTGMNMAEVNRLSGELASHASHVDAVTGAVDAIVQRVHASWAGEDASRFVTGWHSSRARLTRTAQDMREMARYARDSAYMQWRISNS